MAVGSIKFKISADIKELKTAMSEASKSVQDTASKAKNSSGLFSGMTNGLKSIGSAALGAMAHIGKMAASITIFKVINSTLNTLGSSVQSAFNRADTMYTFDRAMTRITGSSKEAGDVLDEVNAIVTKTPYGLDVAARAVQGFANSNLGVKDSVKYVESWADAVTAYGDGSNDTLQRVTFQLQQMAAKGKVNLGDLNSAMEAGIPVLQIYAKATGQSMEELRTNITKGSITTEDFMRVMDEAFRNGTEGFASIAGESKKAGATWRGTFDNMSAATTRGVLSIIEAIDSGLKGAGLPTIKEAVAMYGKTLEEGMKDLAPKIAPAIKDLVDKFNSIKPVLDSVWTAFSELAESIGGKLVGAFGEIGGAVGSVFKTLADFITANMPTIEQGISMAIDIITGVFLGMGDTVEQLMPSLQTLMDIFKGVMEGITGMVPEGKSLSEVVREWTPTVLKAIIAFKTMQGGVTLAKGAVSGFVKVMSAFGTIKTFFAALSGGAGAFAKLGTGGKMLIVVFKAVGTVVSLLGGIVATAFKAIGAAIIANPIMAAIAAVIAVIILLWTNCEWFRDGVKAVWDYVVKAFVNAGKGIVKLVNSIGKSFNDAGKSIGKIIDSIVAWMKDVGTAVSEVWSSVCNAFSTAMQFISNVVQVAFMLIYNIISGVFRAAAAILFTVLDTIRYIWQITWTVLSDFLKGIWNGIVSFMTPIVKGIASFIDGVFKGIQYAAVVVWTAIRDFINATWQIILDIFKPILDAIYSYIGKVWNSIKTTTENIWNAICNFFISIWNSIVAFFTPIINTISETVSSVWNSIKSVTETVWNAVSTFFIGIWEGIKEVISTTVNSIKETVSNVWDSIKESISSTINSIKETVSSVWDGIKEVTANTWNAVKEAIAVPINAAKDLIESVINTIKGFFEGLKLKFPEIDPPKLPHFSISGSFSLNPPSVPSLAIDWYATGGIATGASVVGIGEAGDEAIVPLSNKSRMKPFAQAISSMMNDDKSGSTNNSEGTAVIIKENTFIVRQESDIRKIGQELVKEADRRDNAKGKRKWDD